MSEFHPAIEGVLKHFRFDHLPERLALVSKPFSDLAYEVARRGGDGPEVTVCLRKLLEAKDAAVRAAL